MSDLDADLYGDLYGNDETDFNEQAQEETFTEPAPAESPSTATTTSTTTITKAAETKPVVKPPQVIPTENGAGAGNNTSVQQLVQQHYTQPIQTSYTQPAPQKIPTYEQPQPSEYRELAAPRTDGGYQNIPVTERSVRPSEMKDEGKMFIGGLNWDTTDDALREYFSQFGKVDACTIMRDAAGRSRCFAFLTFEEPASVNAVMVREHFLDGKIIDPKRAIPRQEHQRATKLFIGGLAGSVTSESMREFFSQFGKVIDSTVMLDRETGRSKGFGFVSFEDTNVQPFLGFGNLEIDGKLIDVKLAQPRYQRDSYPNEDGVAGNEYVQGGGNQFGGQQRSFNNPTTVGAAGGNMGGPTAGNTAFDPQALAALYTRMFQMTSAGAMNPAMMGGMNPMMGGMAGGFGGGMRPGMMAGMGGMSGMAGMGGGGMGRGAGGGMMQGGGGGGAGGGMNPNIPRGPRGAPVGPAGAAGGVGAGGGGGGAGMGAASVGPQRTGQRGQHNFHPYAR